MLYLLEDPSPVSYTHLDVYKRQAKGYSFASAEVEMVPSTYTKLTDEEQATKMQKLLDMLEAVSYTHLFQIFGKPLQQQRGKTRMVALLRLYIHIRRQNVRQLRMPITFF